jgi:preprotein translocase subunit SecE
MEQTATDVMSKPKEWVTTLREGYKDVLAEMKKVTWPSRGEVVNTTVVVLVATVVFAVYLWGCDVVFYKAIDFLFSKFGASVSS